jgi:flagellar hook-length control protein FliK
MTFALIETPSRAASSLPNNALELKNEPGTRQDATEFGQVMSDVMGPLKEAGPILSGQALADGPVMLNGFDAVLGSEALKAVHLGPHLNVITAEMTAPDEQSLEAFARSQGLDETAVQWLMGTAPVVATSVPSQNHGTTSLQSPRNGANPLPSQIDGTISLQSPFNGATSIPSQLGNPTPQATPNDLLVAVSSLTLATNTHTSVASTKSPAATFSGRPPGDPMQTATALKPETPVLNSGLNTAALWAMSLPTEQARITVTGPEASSEAEKIQIHMMPPQAPAAVWMLRNSFLPTAVKEALPAKTGIALSELDLSETATPELLESLSQAMAESGSSAPSGASPAHTPNNGSHRHDLAAASRLEAQKTDSSAAAPDAALAQRSENVQNLAEKMGQAVGQRILSEIEKGQWHLKLSLRPATLGHIEVEMRMLSGQLDAVFTASQAMTRELLQDGMSKLKDTLNQMGMDVASMQVGDGQTRQRGGESTPGQMSKSTNTGVNGSESAPAPTVSAPTMKMGEDGWDVLV